jgi:type I restriction enzyme, S subunit
MSWRRETLGNACRIFAGYGFPERLQGQTKGEIPFYKVGDISEAWKKGETYLTTAKHYLTEAEARELKAKPLPTGTTVFAKIGAAIALNRRAMLAQPALVDNNVMGLLPATVDLEPKFLFHFVCTLRLNELSRATTVPSIRKTDVEQIELTVPPIEEQQHIVAEIEKQFTRLDAGVASLKRVQTQLKRYRASVLKAACEGRLVVTEAELARKENRSYETGEELLARIRQVKAEKIRKGEIRKPRVIDSSFLTEPNGPLPEGWAHGRVEDFGSPDNNAIVDGPFGSNLKLSDYTPFGKFPVITISNIDEGYDLASLRKVSDEKFEELKRSAVRAGDIVVAKIGSSFGKTGIYPSYMPVGIIPANLLKVTPTAEMNWKYLFYHLQSLSFKKQLDTIVQYTAQPAFNVSKFKLLPVPIPPFAEQTRIVTEVERRLTVIKEVESVISTELQRAIRLRRSILQKAFSGGLGTMAATV